MKVNGIDFENPGEGKFIAQLRIIDSIDREYVILDKSRCCIGFNPEIRSECDREDLNGIEPDKSIISHITPYLRGLDRIYIPTGSYNTFTYVQLLYGFAVKTKSGEIKSDIVKLKPPLAIRRNDLLENGESTFDNELNFGIIRRYIGKLSWKFEQYERIKTLTSQIQQIATDIISYVEIYVCGCFLYFGGMTKPIGLEPSHIFGGMTKPIGLEPSHISPWL